MTPPSRDQRLLADHFFLAAQRWLHRIEASSVALVCHHGQETPLGTATRPAVEVPGCLQELPLHRLLDLWLAGVRDVALVPGACCGEDGLSHVEERWRSVVGANVSVATLHVTPVRKWAWSLAPNRVPVDRRGLLGLARRTSSPWPTHDVAADDDARLLASLRAAGVTSLNLPASGAALVASGCTSCGVCVQACPQDALTLSIDGTDVSLLQAPDLCRGDQQCVALCPVDALSLHGQLLWTEVLDGTTRVLATLRTAVCERCRATFPAASGDTCCESCRIRRSDPFGSHLPPSALALMRARGHDRRG